jgi:hypothetical protein
LYGADVLLAFRTGCAGLGGIAASAKKERQEMAMQTRHGLSPIRLHEDLDAPVRRVERIGRHP